MEVAPRTLILGDVPNVPDTFCTDTPAALPSRARLISATPSSLTSSALSLLVAPVNRRLSIFCIPVTTTPSRTSVSASREILISPSMMPTSLGFMPRQLISRVFADSLTFKANLPSMSVIVAFLVPFSMTAAPMTGRLSSEEMTTPFTVRVSCANKHPKPAAMQAIIKHKKCFM